MISMNHTVRRCTQENKLELIFLQVEKLNKANGKENVHQLVDFVLAVHFVSKRTGSFTFDGHNWRLRKQSNVLSIK